MRATSPKVVTLAAACLLLLCTAIARAEEGSSLHGSWRLDPQASIDDLGSVSRWSSLSPEETEELRASLAELAGGLGFELSADALTFRRGDRETKFSCSERYDRPSVALLACSTEALELTLTVVRLGEGRIKLLSSVTDDMDVYVWRRAE